MAEDDESDGKPDERELVDEYMEMGDGEVGKRKGGRLFRHRLQKLVPRYQTPIVTYCCRQRPREN